MTATFQRKTASAALCIGFSLTCALLYPAGAGAGNIAGTMTLDKKKMGLKTITLPSGRKKKQKFRMPRRKEKKQADSNGFQKARHDHILIRTRTHLVSTKRRTLFVLDKKTRKISTNVKYRLVVNGLDNGAVGIFTFLDGKKVLKVNDFRQLVLEISVPCDKHYDRLIQALDAAMSAPVDSARKRVFTLELHFRRPQYLQFMTSSRVAKMVVHVDQAGPFRDLISMVIHSIL